MCAALLFNFQLQNFGTLLRASRHRPNVAPPTAHNKEEEVPGIPVRSALPLSWGPDRGGRAKAQTPAQVRDFVLCCASELYGNWGYAARRPRLLRRRGAVAGGAVASPSGFPNSLGESLGTGGSEVSRAARPSPNPRRPPPAASSVSRRPCRSRRRGDLGKPQPYPRCRGFRAGGRRRGGTDGDVKAKECPGARASGERAGLQRCRVPSKSCL